MEVGMLVRSRPQFMHYLKGEHKRVVTKGRIKGLVEIRASEIETRNEEDI